MQYFSQTFTPQTWKAFRDAGASQTGFSASMRSRARAVAAGDRIICYLKGHLAWVGALDALGSARDGGEAIWGEGEYPVRVDVRPAALLDESDAVRVAEMEGQLSIYPSGRPIPFVTQRFQGSPQRLSGEDGEVIYRALLSREDGVRSRAAIVPVEMTPSLPELSIPRAHSEIQAALVDLGMKMDCHVWIPRSDRIAVSRAAPDMPTTRLLAALPPIFGGHAEDTVRNIDVIWFKGPLVVAAFEVENSTAIYSGILRMADLVSLVPNIAFPLYIVADENRRGDVRREILRPAFQNSRVPLEKACAFLSYRAIRDIRSRYNESQLRRLEPRFIDVEAEYFSRAD